MYYRKEPPFPADIAIKYALHRFLWKVFRNKSSRRKMERYGRLMSRRMVIY